MTLQASGAISLNNVNTELGNSGTATIGMNDRRSRQLADSVSDANMTPATGAYGMNSFYGKSRYRTATRYGTSAANRTNTGHVWTNQGSGTWRCNPYPLGWPSPGSAIDSDSLDILVSQNNNYIDGTNWSGGGMTANINGALGAGTSWATAYVIPFWNSSGPGNAPSGYGSQGATGINSGVWKTFTNWSWSLYDTCRTYHMFSVIVQFAPTGIGTTTGYVDIYIGSSNCWVDANI